VVDMARGRMVKRSAGASAQRPGRTVPGDSPGGVPAATGPSAGPASDDVATRPDTVHPDVLAVAQIVGVEARRLRASVDLPAHERRELLADLASRLDALVTHLVVVGLAVSTYASLRRLVVAIEHGGDLNGLWAEALRVLDGYGAGDVSAGDVEAADAQTGHKGSTKRGTRGGTFWKR
jgi:Ca-activated chloride channel family protein